MTPATPTRPWWQRLTGSWVFAAVVFVLLYLPFGPVRVGDGNTCFSDETGQQWCTLAYAPRLESLLGLQDWWLWCPLIALALPIASRLERRDDR